MSSVPRNALRLRLELLVELLRAADEAHARETIAPAPKRLMRGGLHRRMLRKTEVIVRAKIQHRSRPSASANADTLRRADGRSRFYSPGGSNSRAGPTVPEVLPSKRALMARAGTSIIRGRLFARGPGEALSEFA